MRFVLVLLSFSLMTSYLFSINDKIARSDPIDKLFISLPFYDEILANDNITQLQANFTDLDYDGKPELVISHTDEDMQTIHKFFSFYPQVNYLGSYSTYNVQPLQLYRNDDNKARYIVTESFETQYTQYEGIKELFLYENCLQLQDILFHKKTKDQEQWVLHSNEITSMEYKTERRLFFAEWTDLKVFLSDPIVFDDSISNHLIDFKIYIRSVLDAYESTLGKYSFQNGFDYNVFLKGFPVGLAKAKDYAIPAPDELKMAILNLVASDKFKKRLNNNQYNNCDIALLDFSLDGYPEVVLHIYEGTANNGTCYVYSLQIDENEMGSFDGDIPEEYTNNLESHIFFNSASYGGTFGSSNIGYINLNEEQICRNQFAGEIHGNIYVSPQQFWILDVKFLAPSDISKVAYAKTLDRFMSYWTKVPAVKQEQFPCSEIQDALLNLAEQFIHNVD